MKSATESWQGFPATSWAHRFAATMEQSLKYPEPASTPPTAILSQWGFSSRSQRSTLPGNISAGLMRHCCCCCHDPEKRSGPRPPPPLPLSPLPHPLPTNWTRFSECLMSRNRFSSIGRISNSDYRVARDSQRHVPSSFREKDYGEISDGGEWSCIDVRGSRSLRLTRSARPPRRSFWNDRKRELLSGSSGSFANPVFKWTEERVGICGHSNIILSRIHSYSNRKIASNCSCNSAARAPKVCHPLLPPA